MESQKVLCGWSAHAVPDESTSMQIDYARDNQEEGRVLVTALNGNMLQERLSLDLRIDTLLRPKSGTQEKGAATQKDAARMSRGRAPYIYTCMYIYIYIYMYIERERHMYMPYVYIYIYTYIYIDIYI